MRIKELTSEGIYIFDSITDGETVQSLQQTKSEKDTIVSKEKVHKDTSNATAGIVLTDTTKPEQRENNISRILLNNPNIQTVGEKSTSDSVMIDSTKKTAALVGNNQPENKFDFNHLKNSNFHYRFNQVIIKNSTEKGQSINNLSFESHLYQRSQMNWTLIVGLLSIFLLLILKAYYQKFMALIFNSLINIQLAEKMLREKNIITRRAFFILNVNYLLIFSLFVFLLSITWYNRNVGNKINVYLIICGGVTAILLLRIIIFYLFGLLFERTLLSLEYVHNINLINKVVGIVLLPFVFSAIYIPSPISKIVLAVGLIVVCMATLFKIFRGFQIIVKNEVLLFYSILYLCTLELLPLIIGSKIVFLLR